jgi:hypothetical protein
MDVLEVVSVAQSRIINNKTYKLFFWMIFLFPIGTAPKISRLKQSRLLILIGRERFLNGFFYGCCCPIPAVSLSRALRFGWAPRSGCKQVAHWSSFAQSYNMVRLKACPFTIFQSILPRPLLWHKQFVPAKRVCSQ